MHWQIKSRTFLVPFLISSLVSSFFPSLVSSLECPLISSLDCPLISSIFSSLVRTGSSFEPSVVTPIVSSLISTLVSSIVSTLLPSFIKSSLFPSLLSATIGVSLWASCKRTAQIKLSAIISIVHTWSIPQRTSISNTGIYRSILINDYTVKSSKAFSHHQSSMNRKGCRQLLGGIQRRCRIR